MHNLKSLALAPLACVLLAGSLSAQTGTGTMKLSGVNGASDCFGPTVSSEQCAYTSPYLGQFNNLSPSSSAALLPSGVFGSSSTFGPTVDVFCVDFYHSSYIGQVANVYLTNLGTGSLGTYTRSSSLQGYLESAWLAQQILAQPQSGGAYSTADALDMNGAIWRIMTGSADFYRGASDAGIQKWYNLALANWNGLTNTENGVNASNWVVVTPQPLPGDVTTLGNSQEYITQVTPEPATILLLGTGLVAMMLAMGAFRRPVA